MILMKMGMQKISALAVDLENWWFDLSHRVKTRATKADAQIADKDLSAGFWYLPTRSAVGRNLLRALPIADYRHYSFVDFGSGRGRMLLLAGEYPFASVQGVELNTDLHLSALENIGRNSGFTFRSGRIESINQNALNYEFPSSKLVLYFFNPFGEAIFKKVLSRLEKSLLDNPRDAVLVVLYPEHSQVLDQSPVLEVVSKKERCHIYRSCPFAHQMERAATCVSSSEVS